MNNKLVSGNLIILWPFLIMLVGLALYWLCTDATAKNKLARLGEMTFFAGLLALAFALISHTFNI